MLKDHQTCSFLMYIRDLYRSSLPQRFDLYCSKAGMSSMFNGLVPSLAQAYVQMYRLSNTQDKITISIIHVFFYTSSARHLSIFTILLANFPTTSYKDTGAVLLKLCRSCLSILKEQTQICVLTSSLISVLKGFSLPQSTSKLQDR